MTNSEAFSSVLIKQHPHNHARVMHMTTPHGDVTTPAFMPVGTRAVVNTMTPSDLLASGSQIILGGNTYHMLCAPGLKVIEAAGGMHTFMAWQGPMLTDSGGFQVFSLAKNSKICRINETGAKFRHPLSGQILELTPESSLHAQKIIGADIIMAFDECTPDTEDRLRVLAAMERTHRWLRQCKEYHERHPTSAYGHRQALFGIIQGAFFEDLRQLSAEFVVGMELDGIAIGGETIGFDMAKTGIILDWIRPQLPANKVRYTMGVGLYPQDLLDVVASGADIFDCVAPTRNARHGSLYCGQIIKENRWLRFASDQDKGRILIKKACYANDHNPIMPDCRCYTCRHHTRAYLHHLFKEKSIAYYQLACIHNIHVMHSVCEAMRACILEESTHCFNN